MKIDESDNNFNDYEVSVPKLLCVQVWVVYFCEPHLRISIIIHDLYSASHVVLRLLCTNGLFRLDARFF